MTCASSAYATTLRVVVIEAVQRAGLEHQLVVFDNEAWGGDSVRVDGSPVAICNLLAILMFDELHIELDSYGVTVWWSLWESREWMRRAVA